MPSRRCSSLASAATAAASLPFLLLLRSERNHGRKNESRRLQETLIHCVVERVLRESPLQGVQGQRRESTREMPNRRQERYRRSPVTPSSSSPNTSDIFQDRFDATEGESHPARGAGDPKKGGS